MINVYFVEYYLYSTIAIVADAWENRAVASTRFSAQNLAAE